MPSATQTNGCHMALLMKPKAVDTVEPCPYSRGFLFQLLPVLLPIHTYNHLQRIAIG